MRTMTGALSHADWRTALCLGALLLTLWCPPGRTEHLGADFAWMAGVKGRGNEACCAVLDCVEATVALLEHNEMESTVMVGETVLTLPSAWVHPSQGPTCALSARFAAIATKVCRPFGPESPFSLYAANSLP